MSRTGLLLELPSGGPAHQRVRTAIRDAIRAGRLTAGDALPASRQLADDLGVSRWVVTEAYHQLVAEGYLVARPGSATRVAEAARRAPETAPATSPPGTAPARQLDLRPGRPDLASFPRTAWVKAYASAVRQVDTAHLGYPAPAGVGPLRAAVADYLRRVRGFDADPDRVVITRGTTHGVALVSRLLRERGARRLAVEDPGWPRLADVARRQGLGIDAVAVDEGGIEVDRLPSGADAVLVTPAHQFPTGTTLSASRRSALLAWATASGGLLVEDDYDAEFRYDHRPLAALAGLDDTHVAYLGSVSKTLAPALRLGWLVVPESMQDAVRSLTDGQASSGALEQHALVELITSGGYDRHLRRMRRLYQARRDALVTALRAHLPDLRVAGVAAGLHLLVTLPGLDVAAAVERLQSHGIRTTPLSAYRQSPGPDGLVLSFASTPTHQASAVARQLADVMQSTLMDS